MTEEHRYFGRGLGVLVVRDDDEARDLVDRDPAITSGLATSEISPMPVAVVAR